MTQHHRFTRALTVVACLWGGAFPGQAQDRGVVFKASPKAPDSAPEVARIAEPADGQFVYSSDRPPARPMTRFAIGQAPRTDFTIFSAEEQRELDNLRERTAATQGVASPSTSAASTGASGRVVRPAHSSPRKDSSAKTKRATACLETSKPDGQQSAIGPKVIADGDKVCVPKLDFAEQPDWRDHLWCFNKGDGSVR